MKTLTKYTFYISFLCLSFLMACNQEDLLTDDRKTNNPSPTAVVPTGDKGSADFSKLVVVGTGFASGLQDGALYNEGQQNNFAALLGRQLQYEGLNGSNPFKQPDINSIDGFHLFLNTKDFLNFGRTKLSLSKQLPEPVTGDKGISIATKYSGEAKSLNNFSIPIITTPQLLTPATGGPANPTVNPAFSPFYGRFASSPSADGTTGSTVLTDALSAKGSFFIVETGMTDIFFDILGRVPAPKDSEFGMYVTTLINSLATDTHYNPATNPQPAYKNKGIVLGIPPMLYFPYFQAVTYDAVALTKEQAETLNASLKGFNDIMDALIQQASTEPAKQSLQERKIVHKEGKNPILIIDTTLTDLKPQFEAVLKASGLTDQAVAVELIKLEPYRKSRFMKQDELVHITAGNLLNSDAEIGVDKVVIPSGVAVPLGLTIDQAKTPPVYNYESDGSVADVSTPHLIMPSKAKSYTEKIAAFNKILSDTVAAINKRGGDVLFVEMSSFYLDAIGAQDEKGIKVQGINLSPDFAPNGIFSTDGLNPNPRGHGIITNHIIKAISAKWNAKIPEVNVVSLQGPPLKP